MESFKTLKGFLFFALVMSVFALSGRGECQNWDNPGATVSSTLPANAAKGAPTGSKLSVTFSEAMDPTTLTASTFTLRHGATAVPGKVTYSGVTANLAPDSGLLANTLYSATITTGAKDLDGKALAANYAWSFTTGAALDVTKPAITATAPANAASGAAIGNKLSVTFSEAMDPATLSNTTFTLRQGTADVSGAVTYSGVTAVFTPASYLLSGTAYSATVTAAAKDLAGNTLAQNYHWNFVTGTAQDTSAPKVTTLSPASLASGVCVNKTIAVSFSQPMDPLTVSTATFTLKNGTVAVPGTVNYSGVTALFTPTTNLAANTTYSATINTGAQDLAGNGVAGNQTWNFTTGTELCLAPVNLGTAGNFVILAKTGVSTTGTTAVVGDIGASPVAATYLTGFSLIADATNTFATSSYVVGKLYAADYATPTPAAMTTAIGDMETAFTDAAGRTTPDFTELGAGDISGSTLVPGLYKWGTGVLVTGAGVTLSGGPDDVWIFQIAGNLTVNNSAKVTLIGGAQAKNIFWQVSGQATLGTAADFKGIILSQTLISLNTGTKMNGRALAQTAVTLNATAITAP